MAFTVTYNGNGSTGGSVPVDNNNYNSGDTVTVLGNTGNLILSGGTFAYWNTAADGSGTVHGGNQTFTITANVTLYAQWYVTTGLTNGGKTTHYAFAYDSALQAGGLEPARTNALIAQAENDFTLMSGWFGGIGLPFSLPVAVNIANLGGGAGWGPPITLKPGNGNANYCRYLMVSEVSEMLMLQQNAGWFAPDGSNEQSCGEALSRFLGQQFLVLSGTGVAQPGYQISPAWLNSSLPAGTAGSSQVGGTITTLGAGIDNVVTAIPVTKAFTIPFEATFIIQVDSEQMLVTAVDTGSNTLTVTRGYNGTTAASHANKANVAQNYGARADYINVTLEYDHGIDAATGCAMLFIYYLNVQLGFSINQIVGAAPGSSQASSCLRGVYKNLTGDDSDPFPFFSLLLATAFPPNVASTIPGPNPDNPWPIALFHYWGVKDIWGKDEVKDLIATSGGTYPKGFWLMLEGFNKQTVGATTPTTPIVGFTGCTTALDPSGIAYESTNALAPQRIRYPYDVIFDNTAPPAFPASGETSAPVTSAITLLGATFNAKTEFRFVAGADPYFTNVLPNPDPTKENAPYLSEDLRVFTATPSLNSTPVPGGPAFTDDSVNGAYGYAQALIGYLNATFGNPGGTDPFDPTANVIPGQQAALTGDSSVTPYTTKNGTNHNNYNFAIARVRLQGSQGSVGEADGVKVFFRLWQTQTADTDWNPGYTYLSHTDSSGNPLWPLAPSDIHTIPFFATANAPNFNDPNNPEFGTNGVNNRTITINQSDKQWTYFGCFLNLYDDSFIVNGQDVRKSFPGTHHCLVAEIAYAGAPIENAQGVTITPETSSQLAQRNLQVTPSDNPGPATAHRIPQTFDTRLSVLVGEQGLLSWPDELMIDWGNVPAGSLAHIYWPGVAAADVLALAKRYYAQQLLTASDAHTIECRTLAGVTYVPIPFGAGDGLAGLFTVDLPLGVKKGQQFDIVVRRISSRTINAPPPPPPPNQIAIRRSSPGPTDVSTADRLAAVQRDTIVDRYVVGSFQVRIPVQTRFEILPAEETTLAIFKARLGAMDPTNRWYPVLLRYIDYIEGRVLGLGGNPGEIPPSFNGAPIGILTGGQGGPGTGEGEGEGGEERPRAHTGKIAGLLFDHFGDFEGFVLDTVERERAFHSRERNIRDLAELAWRERLRITVYADRDEPHRILRIVVLEPPGKFRP
jgi:Listeria-Bacteroides repeat domain (List_Bact_rpt)